MTQILKNAFILLITSIVLAGFNNKVAGKISFNGLTCDYQIPPPLGIDNEKPHFGWKTQAEGLNDVNQNAYQILIASSEEKINKNKGDVWDSGMIQSSQSVQVPYEGKPLVSKKRYYWKVRIEK